MFMLLSPREHTYYIYVYSIYSKEVHYTILLLHNVCLDVMALLLEMCLHDRYCTITIRPIMILGSASFCC